MSESTQNPNSFPPHYEMPVNQLVAEMDLHGRYEQQFPDKVLLMQAGLADVQRASGINIPKYRAVDREATDAMGLNDDLGFLNAPFSARGSDVLTLQLPVTHTQEQIDAMTDIERREASKTHDGTLIIGDLPAETRGLLDGLYALTGASVVRDGHADGEADGVLIRRGEYQGTAVFFAEYYDDASPYYEGKPTLHVRMLGSETADQMIHEPSRAEKEEFIALSGIDRFEANSVIATNNVTRENYQQIADVLRQTRDIVEGD